LDIDRDLDDDERPVGWKNRRKKGERRKEWWLEYMYI
jgi:hypothetical protein